MRAPHQIGNNTARDHGFGWQRTCAAAIVLAGALRVWTCGVAFAQSDATPPVDRGGAYVVVNVARQLQAERPDPGWYAPPIYRDLTQHLDDPPFMALRQFGAVTSAEFQGAIRSSHTPDTQTLYFIIHQQFGTSAWAIDIDPATNRVSWLSFSTPRGASASRSSRPGSSRAPGDNGGCELFPNLCY